MKTHAILQPYSFLSTNFIKSYIVTMRPYLLFVSGITGITGMSFISELSNVNAVLIFTASFLSYGFGQALTDCFQIDTDTLSSPYRPLTQGIVSKNHFLIISICGLMFCISVFALNNPNNLILGLAGGFGLATYTYFKRKWWAGPFYNAWIVTALFFMAFLSDNQNLDEINLDLLLPAALAVFFGYANFVLAGYFKDIKADSATGYLTFPVVFGRRLSVYASDVFAGLFILSALTVHFQSIQLRTLFYNLPAMLFVIVGIIQSLKAQIKILKVKIDEQAYSSIELVVHSYILILSGITVSQKPVWFLPLILFYAAFIWVMSSRPMKNQI